MNARFAAAAVVLPLLLTACSSDAGVALSADEANAALLTSDDVGEGFKTGEFDEKGFITQAASKPGKDTRNGGKEKCALGCLDDVLAAMAAPHALTADASAQFVSQEAKMSLVVVAHAVTTFESESVAADFLASLEKRAGECPTAKAKLPGGLGFKATVTTSTKDAPDAVDGQLKIGADATIAAAKVVALPVRLSFSFVRLGGVVMMLAYHALAPTESFETELFVKAYQRLMQVVRAQD